MEHDRDSVNDADSNAEPKYAVLAYEPGESLDFNGIEAKMHKGSSSDSGIQTLRWDSMHV